MRRMGEDHGNLQWEAKQAAQALVDGHPDGATCNQRFQLDRPLQRGRHPAVGIEPRELDRLRKREEPPLGGAEFADHKTACARLEKSPIQQRLAMDPGRWPRAYPQPLVRPHQANTGQMAGLFFREFSKIAPGWVSGGMPADHGFAQAFKLALCARRINGAVRMPIADSRRPDSPPSRP